jgi:IS30 family transposase
LIERSTRFVKIAKLSRKTAKETSFAIHKTLKNYPEKARLSITYDNGTENVLHEKINEKLNMSSYFCEPYHSWEKGSIENINGLIRRFFPKGTDFNNVTEFDITYVENWINNRPMRCLEFKTPREKFKELLKQNSA